MLKSKAFELLGGTATSVAAAVGVTPSAVSQWPDELPARIQDRVLAALARKHLPAGLLGEPVARHPCEAASRVVTADRPAVPTAAGEVVFAAAEASAAACAAAAQAGHAR